jgi:hypothetical protein
MNRHSGVKFGVRGKTITPFCFTEHRNAVPSMEFKGNTRESEILTSCDTIDIEDATGKTVERITVTNEPDFRAITVRFADQTALQFMIHPRIEIEPELVDWTTGDGEGRKEYPTIYEHEE